MSYLYLCLAIAGEVTGTLALKASDSCTRPIAVAVVILGYGVALLFLSLALRTLPVGTAYAIWSGAGTILIVICANVLFQQTLDPAGNIGIALIVAGVVILNAFSTAAWP
jgi:small multidrug resistance pump